VGERSQAANSAHFSPSLVRSPPLPPTPALIASNRPKRTPDEPSPFEELLSEDGAESSGESSDEDLSLSPRPALGLKGSSRRKKKAPKFDADKILGDRDHRHISHQRQNTGIIQDIRLWMLLKIDSMVNTSRAFLHRRFQAIKDMTFRTFCAKMAKIIKAAFGTSSPPSPLPLWAPTRLWLDRCLALLQLHSAW